jgi:acylphosphatase
MPKCKRAWISGRVQGVAFRAATRAQAEALGLRGHARNLPDGRVEVLACGDEHALETLLRWLQIGPPAARVDSVRVEDAPADDGPPDFRVG